MKSSERFQPNRRTGRGGQTQNKYLKAGMEKLGHERTPIARPDSWCRYSVVKIARRIDGPQLGGNLASQAAALSFCALEDHSHLFRTRASEYIVSHITRNTILVKWKSYQKGRIAERSIGILSEEQASDSLVRVALEDVMHT